MVEKKQKILAREYFKGSKLFTADVLSGMDNSATSYNAEYELKCKKCQAEFKRKGNARNLTTCAGCKRVWNREDNTIAEPEKKVKAAGKKKVEEPVEEEEEEAHAAPLRKSTRIATRKADTESPRQKASRKALEELVAESDEEVPVPKKTTKKTVKKPVVQPISEDEEEDEDDEEIPQPKIPDHDVDIVAQILKGEIEPKSAKAKPKTLKNELKEGEYWVEEILDYYDEHEDGRWHRFYLAKWWNDPKPTFIRADNFTDEKMIEKYEKSIPTSERFKNMFPNPKISKRTGKEKIGHRTKADVEKGMAEETEVTTEPRREKIQLELVYLKAGHRYFDRKTGTLFLLDGDKDLDQIVFELI